MQVQLVQNINSNVNFKSNDGLEKSSALVNMDDAQLKNLAVKISHNKKEQNEKIKKNMMLTFWAIPIADIIANGVLAKNAVFTESKDVAAVLIQKTTPLSTKAHAALRTAGLWGLVIGAFALYKAIKRVVSPESENPKNRKLKNPLTSILVDIAVMLGGITLVSSGVRGIMKQFPEKVDKMKNNYVNKLSKLDKSNFNKNTLPELQKLADKFPGTAAVGRFLLANSVWIILGAGIGKVFNNIIKEQKKVEKTYRDLKLYQAEAIKAEKKLKQNDEKNVKADEKVTDKKAETKQKKTEEPKQRVEIEVLEISQTIE